MAGHSKRKLSGRKAGRRYENKRYRAADKQVIGGGNSKLVRHDKWGLRPRQPLLEDESLPESVSYPDSRSRPPKKQNAKKRKAKRSPYCPARSGQKHHHFLTDQREVPFYSFLEDLWGQLSDSTQQWIGRRYRTEYYKLCAYCGEERTVRKK